jgi:hypothetical protein
MMKAVTPICKTVGGKPRSTIDDVLGTAYTEIGAVKPIDEAENIQLVPAESISPKGEEWSYISWHAANCCGIEYEHISLSGSMATGSDRGITVHEYGLG